MEGVIERADKLMTGKLGVFVHFSKAVHQSACVCARARACLFVCVCVWTLSFVWTCTPCLLCQVTASSCYPALTSGGVQYLPLACHISHARFSVTFPLFMKLSNIKYRLQQDFLVSFPVARTEYFTSVAVQIYKRYKTAFFSHQH